MNKAIKRVVNKDIKSIEHNKLNDQGIYIEFDEQDMLSARAMIIGPKDSIYEGGFLFFYIKFPKNYPYLLQTLHTFHQIILEFILIFIQVDINLDYGKVCLSILGDAMDHNGQL